MTRPLTLAVEPEPAAGAVAPRRSVGYPDAVNGGDVTPADPVSRGLPAPVVIQFPGFRDTFGIQVAGGDVRQPASRGGGD